MAIKFQYNKTSLQQIEKALKMRQRTLPIIKSKETALRLEVKKCKEEADDLERQLQSQIEGYERMYALWGEFDASIPAILLHFQADMSSVSLKVVNLETGEQFCTVIRGKKGMVVPVFVSSGEGVYQVTFIPGNSGIQADSRTVEK